MHSAGQTWRQTVEARLRVRGIILEVKLQLDFFNLWLLRAQQQQEVNNTGSSDGLSLQSYTSEYWPGMHTAALSVVRVNMDIFWRHKGETFPFLAGLLPSKRGFGDSNLIWQPALPPLHHSHSHLLDTQIHSQPSDCSGFLCSRLWSLQQLSFRQLFRDSVLLHF